MVAHIKLPYVPHKPRVPKYVMIIGRMVILVRSALTISWSADWGQPVLLAVLGFQRIAIAIEKLSIGIESVSVVGFNSPAAP